MSDIVLKVLGAQSPFSNSNQACPSYLIDDGNSKILLDCGSGSHRFFDMKLLDKLNIFISHLHRDHYNDIFNYQYASYTLHNLKQIKDPINIYLPEINSTIAKDIISESNAYSNYFSIDENKVYEIGDFKITFSKMEHSIEVEMFAIKVCNKDKTIVYSGDVSYSCKDKLIEFSKNADLLICESSLLNEHNFPKVCSHLTAQQAASIAKEANVQQLMLTHFWPYEDVRKYYNEATQVFDNIIIAKEEDVISL